MEDPAQAKGLVGARSRGWSPPARSADPGCSKARRRTSWPALALGAASGGRAAPFSTSRPATFFVRRWRDAPTRRVEELAAAAAARGAVSDRARKAFRPQIARAGPSASAPAARRSRGDRLSSRDGAARALAAPVRRRARCAASASTTAEPAVRAAAAALAYAQETQQSALCPRARLAVREAQRPPGARRRHARQPRGLRASAQRRPASGADPARRARPHRDRRRAARLLREWLRRPLRRPRADRRAPRRGGRAGGDSAAPRAPARARSARVHDLERLLARAVLGTLTPREAAALRDALAEAAGAAGASGSTGRRAVLGGSRRPTRWPSSAPSSTRVARGAAAPSSQDGGVIADGVDDELDGCRSLARRRKRQSCARGARARAHRDLVAQGRLQQGLRLLHRGHQAPTSTLVPADYIRKQTLVNAERFVTAELKEHEERGPRRRGAAGRARGRSSSRGCASAIAVEARGAAPRWPRRSASSTSWRPSPRSRRGTATCGRAMASAGRRLEIGEGRHPVVEQRAPATRFVPNDTARRARARRSCSSPARTWRASRPICARSR